MANTTSPKTTPLPIRFPNELIDHIKADAVRLRRSKASIILQINKKNYLAPPVKNVTPKKASSN